MPPIKQDGFSLIEVVASIALIAVLLLSFMTFFVHTAQVTERAGNKADAGQISQEILYEAQSGDFQEDLTTQDFNTIYGTTQNQATPYVIELNNVSYTPSVRIRPDGPAWHITVVISTIEPGGTQKELFRTYGYK